MNPLEKKSGYIADAWLVILLAVLYGGALAGVQMKLGPKIDQNKRNETFDQVPQLVPGADGGQTEELFVPVASGTQSRVYRARAQDGSLAGWVLPTAGQGFADRIELLIGVDATLQRITGLFILDQKETPGLGDYITGEEFRNRFLDKSTTAPLAVTVREPVAENDIQAITGATISSQSVADIVNKALAQLRDPVLQMVKQTAAQ